MSISERMTIVHGDVGSVEDEFYLRMRDLVRDYKPEKVIYICLNKPARVIEEKMNLSKYMDILYIDAVSKEESEIRSDIIYLDRPTDYNSLLELLNQELKKKSIVVLDNLHSIFLYNNHDRVLLFLKNLFNEISEMGSYLVSYLVKLSLETEVEKTVLSFADRIIDLPVQKSRWDEWNRMTFNDLFAIRSPLLYIIFTVQLVIASILVLIMLYLFWKV